MQEIAETLGSDGEGTSESAGGTPESSPPVYWREAWPSLRLVPGTIEPEQRTPFTALSHLSSCGEATAMSLLADGNA